MLPGTESHTGIHHDPCPPRIFIRHVLVPRRHDHEISAYRQRLEILLPVIRPVFLPYGLGAGLVLYASGIQALGHKHQRFRRIIFGAHVNMNYRVFPVFRQFQQFFRHELVRLEIRYVAVNIRVIFDIYPAAYAHFGYRRDCIQIGAGNFESQFGPVCAHTIFSPISPPASMW